MNGIDLNALTLSELKQLEKEVSRAIASFESRRLLEARREVEDLAKRLGFSIDELAQTATLRKKTVSEAKYRNPLNPEQTWTGRGRKPGWLNDALAAGRSIDEFAI
ncbi:H-NS family nucleoid-associated regulatory protein [Paenirhodobacter sp.]|uniref:H-NS histone family protein n=1 Tax=Paenirhodobacter sp. TaxID=1965326 RepID=UPI003B3D732D